MRSQYGTNSDVLVELVSKYQQEREFSEEVDYMEALGESDFLLNALKTSLKGGIDDNEESLQQRSAVFGNNEKPVIKPFTFCQLLCIALNDFTLKILMVASIVNITVSTIVAHEDERATAWIEGFSMIVAVMIVSTVTAVNDLQKQKQFAELNDVADSKRVVNVVRGGQLQEIHQKKLLVGDIMIVREGIQLPADGVVVKNSDITTDESAMTGETDPLKKDTLDVCIEKRNQIIADGGKNSSGHHDVPSPILMSGTKVLTGEGKMLILVVGDKSCEGKIETLLRSNTNDATPLQQKLETIANDIGKFGTISAIAIFLILTIRFAIENALNSDKFQASDLVQLLRFFILGIAVIVMAIPEGLPLSVTISLAYSVKRMLQDQNLVRKMQACETMGGANMICSDKTGTLTQNKMTLTKLWNDQIMNIDTYSDQIKLEDYVPVDIQQLFIQCTAVNSSAILKPQMQGSKTEIAILQFLEKCGIDFEQIRESTTEVKKMPFSSSRKRMGVIIMNEDQTNRLVEKGASEMVVECCTHYHSFRDGVKPIEAYKQQINESIIQLANQALRTIGLAYREMGNEANPGQTDEKGIYDVEKSNLVLIGVLGIKDILRQEVPGAVMDCRNAGIKVRMVTGDNKLTATAIAKECNIVQQGDTKSIVMEGIEFIQRIGGVICTVCKTQICDCPRDIDTAKKVKKAQRIDTIANPEEFDKIYPNLDVLARSRPEDKYALVTGLIERGHVVAVTGDGTNDAPALKKADVGFAMGIAGTEVAKQASSIILLDDNFNSIVKAVMWGRNIYDSIKKFLQFQLTVNVVGVGITIIGSATIKSEILTPIQMLWINLIMDALASLALATESPTRDLLLRKPHKRDDYIVSKKMFKHIIGQSIYQLLVLTILTFAEHSIPESSDDQDTVIRDKLISTSQLTSDLQKWRNSDSTYVSSYNAKGEDEKKKLMKGLASDALYNQLGYGLRYGDGNVTSVGSIIIYCIIAYVRSGRFKALKDNENYYDFLTKSRAKGGFGLDSAYIKSQSGEDYNTIKLYTDIGPSRHFTFLFNTFLWMTIFNFINARKLKDEMNVFAGITKNMLFVVIVVIIIVSQILIVSVSGKVMNCYSQYPTPGLNAIQWLMCVAYGSGGLIVSVLLKLINEDKISSKQGYGNVETNPNDNQSKIMSLRRSSQQQQVSNRLNAQMNAGSNQFR